MGRLDVTEASWAEHLQAYDTARRAPPPVAEPHARASGQPVSKVERLAMDAAWNPVTQRYSDEARERAAAAAAASAREHPRVGRRADQSGASKRPMHTYDTIYMRPARYEEKRRPMVNRAAAPPRREYDLVEFKADATTREEHLARRRAEGLANRKLGNSSRVKYDIVHGGEDAGAQAWRDDAFKAERVAAERKEAALRADYERRMAASGERLETSPGKRCNRGGNGNPTLAETLPGTTYGAKRHAQLNYTSAVGYDIVNMGDSCRPVFPAPKMPIHPSRSAKSAHKEREAAEARYAAENYAQDRAFNRCKVRFERDHRPRDIISGETVDVMPRTERTVRRQPDRKLSAGAMMRASAGGGDASGNGGATRSGRTSRASSRGGPKRGSRRPSVMGIAASNAATNAAAASLATSQQLAAVVAGS